jgi:hypothetical protein
MAVFAFDNELTLTGPFRAPRQMLADQEYDGHTSVHDDATADKLGLPGAPIEGPTHFSQFDPIGVAMWGSAWFEHGCISSHFENMVIEGEEVQATATRTSATSARIGAVKSDGNSVLSGTMTLGPNHSETELDRRLGALKDPGELFIIDQMHVGDKSAPERVSMSFTESNGHLYPFSLNDKLQMITEPSPWYASSTAAQSPWGRAVIPTEMVSVLAHKVGGVGKVRGPAVGLFIDLEIRVINGPLFVDAEYELVHEIVGMGQSRRVESYWTRTSITDPASGVLVATVLLHQGVFKASYDKYPADKLAP